MEEKTTYKCSECGNTINSSDAAAPECCGMPMEKLPFYRSTDTAEQARAYDEGEPCNDYRDGR